MKITNNTERTIGLAGNPSVVLDAGKTAVVDNEQFKTLQGPRFDNWLGKGFISVAKGGKQKPKAPKPSGVDVKHVGGRKYRLFVNGVDVSQEDMKLSEAKKLAENYDV